MSGRNLTERRATERRGGVAVETPERQLVRGLAVAALALAGLYSAQLYGRTWISGLPFGESWGMLLSGVMAVFALLLGISGAWSYHVGRLLLSRSRADRPGALTAERASDLQQVTAAGLISLATGLFVLGRLLAALLS